MDRTTPPGKPGHDAAQRHTNSTPIDEVPEYDPDAVSGFEKFNNAQWTWGEDNE
jgi:hypothetical protein